MPAGVAVAVRAARRFHVSGAAVLALAAALAVGCSGPPTAAPTGPTPVSTTTVPTATPSVSPPTPPPAEKSAQGAETFAGYFWQLYDYMYATGDTQAFLQVAETSCTFCADAAAAIDAAYLAGGRIEGGRTTLLAAAAEPVEIASSIVVAITFTQQAGIVVNQSGARGPSSSPDAAIDASMRLLWIDGAWKTGGVATRAS